HWCAKCCSPICPRSTATRMSRRPCRPSAAAGIGMARRKEAHGGHGLLVSFFVMLVAFSTQDSAKLQVVAGSMREAFGVQDRVRYSGVIEMPGVPTRPKLKNG